MVVRWRWQRTADGIAAQWPWQRQDSSCMHQRTADHTAGCADRAASRRGLRAALPRLWSLLVVVLLVLLAASPQLTAAQSFELATRDSPPMPAAPDDGIGSTAELERLLFDEQADDRISESPLLVRYLFKSILACALMGIYSWGGPWRRHWIRGQNRSAL